jgi:hypothetical protein
MSFGPTSSDVGAPPPHRRHDVEFLGNFLK